ncbi:hypothetical protein A2U01_0052426 [Trifolium medium]|uniref:Uncharacterized protein n=1 Tax=Trifolium medium TaxID=97028 RepID=A0A392R535_9FABA|nr:hypothetical protein [Trifolium medium]
MVKVSSLEVVLVEGESNEVYDEAYRHYRLEAERLFDIGMNFGVSTNADRISMVEIQLDLEQKEVDAIDDWEDEEVDQ